jgi:hypothetical protein
MRMNVRRQDLITFKLKRQTKVVQTESARARVRKGAYKPQAIYFTSRYHLAGVLLRQRREKREEEEETAGRECNEEEKQQKMIQMLWNVVDLASYMLHTQKMHSADHHFAPS